MITFHKLNRYMSRWCFFFVILYSKDYNHTWLMLGKKIILEVQPVRKCSWLYSWIVVLFMIQWFFPKESKEGLWCIINTIIWNYARFVKYRFDCLPSLSMTSQMRGRNWLDQNQVSDNRCLRFNSVYYVNVHLYSKYKTVPIR